jgi:hypothetical protein
MPQQCGLEVALHDEFVADNPSIKIKYCKNCIACDKNRQPKNEIRQCKLSWNDMKIDISKKEYRQLLDMVEIAEWVLNSHSTGPSDETKEYSDIYQKILSHAKDMGYEKLITYDKDLDGYFATAEYEESEHMRYIEEFEDEVFWEALPHRLAVRDLVKQFGEKKYTEMEFEERVSKLIELESVYNKELEENGIDNLRFENLTKSAAPDLH